MIQKFRKKPVVIEAMHWMGGATSASKVVDWILQNGGTARYHDVYHYEADLPDLYEFIAIDTLEGVMQAVSGDWIIRGVKGEFYPCKPDIFEATYEVVS